NRYASWTIEGMRDWIPRPDKILEIQMERLSARFDLTMRRALRHLGFEGRQLNEAMAIAAQEDTGRMSDAQIAKNSHIHSRTLSKWKGRLTEADICEIESRFGAEITKLGYELDGSPSKAARLA